MAMPGTSVMAAAAAYAGIQVRGSLREMEARLAPLKTSAAVGQQRALDSAGAELVPRLLDEEGREDVARETLDIARQLMKRLRETRPVGAPSVSDVNDDRLISHDEAAAVILGLQDRDTRDRAAEWMEGPEADSALRLWRALSRRCVTPYEEHAAAPLTLAGWVSWSTGDEPGARVALGLALRMDPDYTFAQLLHEACNQGLDPETLRRCLRGERSARTRRRSHRPDRSPRPRAARPAGTRRKKDPSGSARPGPAATRRRSGQAAPGRRVSGGEE